jgi:magnesium transporter
VQVLERFDPNAVAALRARGEFFWLDLTGPSAAEVDEVRRTLGLRPAPEDLPGMRRRLFLQAEDHVVLVCRGADLVDLVVCAFEVDVWVHGDFVLTVHDAPVEELGQLAERIARRKDESEQHMVAKIIDAVTDSYYSVLEELDQQVSELDEEIIERPARSQLEQIAQLQRALAALRRLANPLRDTLRRRADDVVDVPGLEKGARDYLRELADDMGRISEQLDAFASQLTSGVDVYLSRTSNQLNQLTWRLTVVATIFLPLTFVTGFFGQNFGWLVRHVNTLADFLVWGIGGLAVSCLLLVIWFRRQRQLP